VSKKKANPNQLELVSDQIETSREQIVDSLYESGAIGDSAVAARILTSGQDQNRAHEAERDERAACDALRIFLIQREIFCKCGRILDVRSAVLLSVDATFVPEKKKGKLDAVKCGTCLDRAGVARILASFRDPNRWADVECRIIGGKGKCLYSTVRLPEDRF
jgi:hypothetical protein